MTTKSAVALSPERLIEEARKIAHTSIENATELARRALALAYEQEKYDLVFDISLGVGRSLRIQAKGFESLEIFHKAYRVLYRWLPEDTIRRSLLFREYGTLYANHFNDHTAGLEYSLKSLSLNNPTLNAQLYNNIASTCIQLGKFEKALTYLKKAESLFERSPNYNVIPFLHTTFAEYYNLQGLTDLAIQSYKTSIEATNIAYKTVHSTNNIAYVHSYAILGLANIYFKQKNYKLIPKLITEVYEIVDKFNLPGSESTAMVLEGKMYLVLKEINFFKELFNRAIIFCENNELYDDIDFWYSQMIELCESKNKYKEALSFCKAHLKSKASRTAKAESINIIKILENKEIEILALENRNREIQSQRDQLEQFAYIVAHDLKTPLHNISHFVGLFLRKFEHKVDPENKPYLDFVIDNSRKMHMMFDELLIYTSSNENKSPAPFCDVEKLLQKIIKNNKNTIIEKDASFHFENLPLVKIHVTHLQLILSRIINNSLKFTRAGTAPKVRIEIIEFPKEYSFKIIDNGIGIAPEYRDKIFDLFKQLDKVNYQGVGMSLAICKKIISFYGGSIEVHSNESGGATFCFNILKNS